MNNDEIIRVQTYLRLKFQNDMLTLKRGAKDDMVEVFMEDEFIGTLFRDDEEGEISYAFNMAILEFDLPTLKSVLSPRGGTEITDHFTHIAVNGFPLSQMHTLEDIADLRRGAEIEAALASRVFMFHNIANK